MNTADSYLKEQVNSLVASSSEQVFSGVVNILVEEEVNKRKDLVMQAVKKLSNLKTEVYKIKPDNRSYDIDGVLIQESYKKETLEARKKLIEQQEKLSSALDKAFKENDFSKLNDLVK